MDLQSLDAAATSAVNHLAGLIPPLDALMIWTSLLGVPLLVLCVAGQWWRGPDRERRRHVLVVSGLAFLLGLALNQAILLAVHRIRPYDAGVTQLLIAPSADPSFPSDHATAAFAVAAAFLLHGWRRMGAWFLGAAFLLGLSRVWIGIHYLGDVAGGALTGFAAAALVRALYREGTRADRLITRLL